MSFRRFMYLVTDDQKRRTFLLRLIDASRLFLPRRDRDRLLTDPPPLEEARLPPATMSFDPPAAGSVGAGCMQFSLFAAAGGGKKNNNRHRVLATDDDTGRALLYDPESPSVRALPSLTAPKAAPASIAVGDDVYVLATTSTAHTNHQRNCFDGFVLLDGGGGGWHCHALPPPPYVYVHGPYGRASTAYEVGSYAVVGGGVCASDLTVAPAPPTARSLVWSDPAPPRWAGDWRQCFLVHLGGSRFCHASFFDLSRPYECDVACAVITGIEVEQAAGGGGGELCVVRHRAHQYRFPNSSVMQWLL